MPALLLGVALLMATLPEQGTEATILVPEVEVRGGPSATYYATGKLRHGDRVLVKGERNGYLVIQPPPGSFSLVSKAAVSLQSERIGVVTEEADTIVGSTQVRVMNVRGARLHRGALVTILGEVTVPGEYGPPRPYYQIEPAGEDRYLPPEAVQPATLVQAGSAPAPLAGQPLAAGANRIIFTGPYAGQLERADQAYRLAQQTGDWTEARRLYEELANSPDHEVRMIAWNRLEFIKRRPGAWSPPASAGNARYLPPQPALATAGAAGADGAWRPPTASGYRATSTYTYSETGQPGRIAPVPVPAAAAPSPMPARTTRVATPPPVQPAAARPQADAAPARVAAAPAPALHSSGIGRLHRSSRSDQSRKLYYLEDARGEVRCWVTPGPGLELDSFVGQVVEIQGTPPAPRSDLRGHHMTAIRILPLNP